MGADGGPEDGGREERGDETVDGPADRLEDDGREERGDETADGPADRSTDRFEFEDYYDLLGVPSDATREAVERAYREMAKRHHPDVSDRPEAAAERRFRQLLRARDVLTSVETRRAYDELGHEEYRRQSESLGEPVRRVDTAESPETADSEPGPEPRPGPEAGDGPDPGRVQRSPRGEARRRGDPVVASADEAFAGDSTETSGDATDGTGGRGVYGLLSESPPGSRSLRYVAGRWAVAWRNRALVGLGSVGLVAAVSALGPSLLSVAGLGVAAPSPGARSLYLLALGTALGHLVYSSVTAEAGLPRGRFLADRDLGRFATAASRRSRRRGALAVLLALGLAVTGAERGARPWAQVADGLRGDLGDPSPWFDAGSVGLAGLTAPLDALVTTAFALAATLGTVALASGVSVDLWRARYERGFDVHPGLWEWPLVLALVSLPAVFAAGPVALFRLPALSALPETAAAAAGVEGTQVTLGTAAAAGLVLSLAAVPLSRLRLALCSTDSGDTGSN